MRRLLFATLALLVAAPLAAEAAQRIPAGPQSATKVKRTSICHRTSSRARPYSKIAVTAAQLRTHNRHAADIVPAPRGACPRTLLTAAGGGTVLSAALVGETEQPTGDPVGTGSATVRLRAGEGRACFRISAENITFPAAGAHIHLGASGASGAIVIPLTAPATNAATVSGCVAANRTLVRRILASPTGYYVNVHTTDYPGGAIRGQLVRGAVEVAGRTFRVALNGANERPNPPGGDPDGTGTAIFRFRTDGQMCFKIQVQNIELPAVGAHIHRAPSTGNGPIVVPVTSPDSSGVSKGCVAVVQTLADEIQANPAGFYANVHTRAHPGGAIRGQLG